MQWRIPQYTQYPPPPARKGGGGVLSAPEDPSIHSVSPSPVYRVQWRIPPQYTGVLRPTRILCEGEGGALSLLGDLRPPDSQGVCVGKWGYHEELSPPDH